MPEFVRIQGVEFRPGDTLTIRYGNGRQKVRIREITRTGRVKLDRCYAGINWVQSNTPIRVDDPRWDPR